MRFWTSPQTNDYCLIDRSALGGNYASLSYLHLLLLITKIERCTNLKEVCSCDDFRSEGSFRCPVWSAPSWRFGGGRGTSKDEGTKQVFEASPGLTLSLLRPPYPTSLLSLLSQAGNVKKVSPSLGRESCAEGTDVHVDFILGRKLVCLLNLLRTWCV